MILRVGRHFYRVIIYKNTFNKTNMKKGLDISFVHYGIRKEDMGLIETLCTNHQIDFDWLKEEVLKEFHDKKINKQDIEDKTIERLIDKALQKIK